MGLMSPAGSLEGLKWGTLSKKTREPNVSRLWTERGGDRRDPATLYIVLCLCYSTALPQETPSDRWRD